MHRHPTPPPSQTLSRLALFQCARDPPNKKLFFKPNPFPTPHPHRAVASARDDGAASVPAFSPFLTLAPPRRLSRAAEPPCKGSAARRPPLSFPLSPPPQITLDSLPPGRLFAHRWHTHTDNPVLRSFFPVLPSSSFAFVLPSSQHPSSSAPSRAALPSKRATGNPQQRPLLPPPHHHRHRCFLPASGRCAVLGRCGTGRGGPPPPPPYVFLLSSPAPSRGQIKARPALPWGGAPPPFAPLAPPFGAMGAHECLAPRVLFRTGTH